MSYSRRKEHYGAANKRYFGVAYNYESVVEGAANPLIKAGFFLKTGRCPAITCERTGSRAYGFRRNTSPRFWTRR
jgi:hypothetical protein